MQVIKTDLEGVFIIEPKIFTDPRGYFFESFSQRVFNENVREISFVQDNESKSSYGVLRGLHFQKPPFTQSKLVRCIKGCVLDVAVDINGYIQDTTLDATHQFTLGKRRFLKMQSAQNAITALTFIILNEGNFSYIFVEYAL